MSRVPTTKTAVINFKGRERKVTEIRPKQKNHATQLLLSKNLSVTTDTLY